MNSDEGSEEMKESENGQNAQLKMLYDNSPRNSGSNLPFKKIQLSPSQLKDKSNIVGSQQEKKGVFTGKKKR